MLTLARNGYPADQVQAALVAPRRVLRFAFRVFDRAGGLKGYLPTVRQAEVTWRADAQVRRTLRLTWDESPALPVDVGSDRVQPLARLRMPDGGWVDFPLGVFLLTTPPRVEQLRGVVSRQAEGYDLTQVLADQRAASRYTVAAGNAYTDAIAAILQSAGLARAVTPSSITLPTARDWKPGTPLLQIANDLAAAINYRPLWADATGVVHVEPYVPPAQRGATWTYAPGATSVLARGVQQGIDYFAVPNQITAVVSEPDRPPLTSTATNANPLSPTSTVARGRVISQVIASGVQAADQATLDAYVQRLLIQASQVAETVTFETAIMPFHEDSDVLHLVVPELGLDALYEETSWTIPCQAGGRMKHVAQRVVQL